MESMEVYQGAGSITRYAVPVEEMQAQVQTIQHVMRAVMKDGEHYGTIPGCGDKKTLMKPGAEKLMMTFRLSNDIDMTVVEMPNGHREYRIKCTLYSPEGQRLGTGAGSCSTMEGKYRYRNAGYTCPECGAETIIKGRPEYGGGYICFAKKGGCGAKFGNNDPAIVSQPIGRVEHDNPADYYNTCLKMAKKRALVDAVLTTTAASDIFTQDIEDMPEVIPGAAQKVPPPDVHAQYDRLVAEMVDLAKSPQITEAERARLNAQHKSGKLNIPEAITWLKGEIAARKEVEAAEKEGT